MDIERFSQIARDPNLSREQLETMRANALSKNKLDYVRVAEEVLCERFPGRSQRHGGGRTPTTAIFRGQTAFFDSGKDAYIWLVNQFCSYRKCVLSDYHQLHDRAGSRSRGKRFSPDPLSLFPVGSNRRGNCTYYSPVGDGWFADVNLNHDDKFAALLQLSYLSNLEYEQDWDFQVTGATKKLRQHQDVVVRGRKLLDDLLRK